MSPDHEPSYYEIALTNRQVLTIFVVLLTCLVAAFLSGVWIGRRDGVVQTELVAAAETPAEPATARMTELNFFSEGAAAGAGDGERPRERSKAPAASPPPAAAPAEPPPATKPPPKPPASQPGSSSPPPSGGASPAAALAPGRVIQVFSTPDAAQADRLVRRLGSGGYPAYLVEENLQGRTTYRVRVGPYQQEERAQKIADELRREYRLETWITTQPG